MGSIEKKIERLKSKPCDFTWKELKRVLGHFGYQELKHGKTGGSRVKFYNKDRASLITLHRPHNPEIIKKCYINDILKKLSEDGIL